MLQGYLVGWIERLVNSNASCSINNPFYCPTGARAFGDFNDPNSDVSKKVRERGGVDLMPEMQTKPVNKYLLPRIKSKNSVSPVGSVGEEETDATGLLGWVDRALSKF